MSYLKFFACIFVLFGLCDSFAFQLITESEALASQSAKIFESEAKPHDPEAPLIELIQPTGPFDRPLKNPLYIEIAFIPQKGATMDFSTFKTQYGAFKVDITDRLLKQTIKTADGYKLKDVNLPKGYHKLIVSIKDNFGRTGVKEISFKVE